MNKKPRTKDIAIELSAKEFFDNGSGEVTGYASVFGNIDHARDVIEQGAFAKTLQMNMGKIRFLWQHDRYQPIGAIVEMREDTKGLWFRAVFANTPRGQEARELLKMNGAMGGFSIGFQVIVEMMDEVSGINRIKEIRLLEVSAVTFPCNEEATVLGIKDEFSDEELALIEKFKDFIVAERAKEVVEPSTVTEADIEALVVADADIVVEPVAVVEEKSEEPEEITNSDESDEMVELKEALEVALLHDMLRTLKAR